MAWIIQNNQLINDEFINVGTKPFVGDSPYTMWRIDPNANGGIPYSPLMIGVAVVSQEIFCGDIQVTNIYCGDTRVTKVYCGDTQLL